MAIQRKSELRTLMLEVREDGTVSVTAEHAHGAWDGERLEWVGKPHMQESTATKLSELDTARIKDLVGAGFLKLAHAHETLKVEHVKSATAETKVMADHLQLLEAHDQLGKKLEQWRNIAADNGARAAVAEAHVLALQCTEFERTKGPRNPLLHRLTWGRAGR